MRGVTYGSRSVSGIGSVAFEVATLRGVTADSARARCELGVA